MSDKRSNSNSHPEKAAGGSSSTNGAVPDTQSPAKKLKTATGNVKDFINSGTAKITNLKKYKTPHVEHGNMKAGVLAISPKMHDNDLVGKSRRRMVLIDGTGIFSGYVTVEGFKLEVGDLLTASNFRIAHGRFTFHSNTIISRGSHTTFDQMSLDKGQEMLKEPINHYSSMKSLVTMDSRIGQLNSFKGQITKTTVLEIVSSKTFGGRDGKSLRKKIDVQDPNANFKIEVSLYDETALHEVQVGQDIVVHDSMLYKNKSQGDRFVNVYNADNITISEVQPIVQDVTMTGIEETETNDIYVVTIENQNHTTRECQISRDVLLDTIVDEYKEYDVDELRGLCPFTGRVLIIGINIVNFLIYQITEANDESNIVDLSSLFCNEKDKTESAKLMQKVDKPSTSKPKKK